MTNFTNYQIRVRAAQKNIKTNGGYTQVELNKRMDTACTLLEAHLKMGAKHLNTRLNVKVS